MKKRTVIFISDYWFPKIGGMERSIQYLSDALTRSFEVRLLTGGAENCHNSLGEMKVSRFRSEGDRPYYDDAYRTIEESGSCAVCHFFGFSFRWPQQQAALIRRIKTSLALPVLLKVPTSGDVSRYLFAEFAECKNHIDYFIALNSTIETELLASGVQADRIWNVSNCVPTKLFSPAKLEEQIRARKQFNLPKDAFVLGFCGRFIRRKRVDLLIDALGAFPLSRRPYLLLAGYEDQTFSNGFDLLRGLIPNVNFINCQEDMRPFYHALDVYITASEAEGMSNAVLEAISSGLPVLVSPIDGHRELVADGKNGLHFLTNSSGDIIVTIEKAIELQRSGMLKTMGEQSRLLAVSEFDVDIVASRYCKLYDRLFERY